MSRETLQAKAEQLRNSFGGPMTPSEVEFCRDVQGFLEFAIRNGLSFPLVISTLGHDVNNIVRQGIKLETEDGMHAMPKVSGYARVLADAVGGTTEIDSEDAAGG